jgi:hypothetical protein
MVSFAPLKISNAPGQRSLNIDDAYLWRYVAPWSRPSNYSAEIWRNFVKMQPVAIICRETLIANLLSLDWKITPRDSTLQDELKPTIRYYTRLIEKGAYGGLDYSGHLEWICTDLLDLPFGAAAELGRKGDEPGGRVYWMKPLDAGTLSPTLNTEFPVVQYYNVTEPIYFPAHAIDRVYMSPRTDIIQEGWGMAPPEKIYFAIEMLIRGDHYYANLLLDVPAAGILDLADMEKEAAQQWSTAFRELLSNGSDAFKIPVLYEHNNEVKFIPFGKVPNDIMYDRITLKYASIVAAAYGMAASDIGMSMSASGGETLAGTIREERHTRKTGFARIKRKTQAYFNYMLPDSLEFVWIDLDDEVSTALGRARLANATAFNQLTQMGAFTPDEARLQTIADGLITIPVPEKMPEADKKKLLAAKQPTNKPPERPGVLGTVGVSPSAGGIGEIKNNSMAKLDSILSDTVLLVSPILANVASGFDEDNMYAARAMVVSAVSGDEDSLKIKPLIDQIASKNSVKFRKSKSLTDVLSKEFKKEGEASEKLVDTFLKDLSSAVSQSIVRCAVLDLKEFLLNNDDIDNALDTEYDIVIDSLREGILPQIPLIVDACTEVCIEKLIKQVEMEA